MSKKKIIYILFFFFNIVILENESFYTFLHRNKSKEKSLKVSFPLLS